MTDASLEALCRACGLCCDGSLFGRVPVAAAEISATHRHRLALIDDRAFEQPCRALTADGGGSSDRHCTIYDERPRACRRFACRLYERRSVTLEAQLSIVRRVRALLAWATTVTSRDELDAHPDYLELVAWLEEDFARGDSAREAD